MTVSLSPSPILQFFNNNGQPNVGGSLLTQVGGVNYPTYQDSAGATPLPNPIPLNSRGEVSNAAGVSCQLFLTTGQNYTFTLYDASGNQLNQAISLSSQTPSTTATSLASATTTIGISAATAPTAGQVLTATSGTAATWQTMTGAALNANQTFTGANIFSGVCTFSNFASTFAGVAASATTAGTATSTSTVTAGGTVTTTQINATTFIKTQSLGGSIGYSLGLSNTVTQATSKVTGVTLNAAAGMIVTFNDSLAALTGGTWVGATARFLLTNSSIGTGDTLNIAQSAAVGTGTPGAYVLRSECYTGSAYVYITNITGGALAESVGLAFTVIKGN